MRHSCKACSRFPVSGYSPKLLLNAAWRLCGRVFSANRSKGGGLDGMRSYNLIIHDSRRREIGVARSVGPSNEGTGPNFEEEALVEVADILREAEQMAQEQTRQELMLLAASEGHKQSPDDSVLMPVLAHGSEASFPEAVKALQRSLTALGFSCTSELGNFGLETENALKAFQRREGLPPSGVLNKVTMSAIRQHERSSKQAAARIEELRHFWREEGLSGDGGVAAEAVEALVDAIVRRGDGRAPEPDELFAKLQRLRRLLPEVDVVQMARRDPEVLDVDIGLATRNLVALVEGLPGQDIFFAVSSFPRALSLPDLPQRLEATLGRLREWSPRSHAERVLADNPSLLQRVPQFYSRTPFEDLPVDIQNTMVIGGGGGGFVFRAWDNFTDNNTD